MIESKLLDIESKAAQKDNHDKWETYVRQKKSSKDQLKNEVLLPPSPIKVESESNASVLNRVIPEWEQEFTRVDG